MPHEHGPKGVAHPLVGVDTGSRGADGGQEDRLWITELKCTVFLPVYPIIQVIGGACASSKQAASASRAPGGPRSARGRETPRRGSVAIPSGVGTTNNQRWATEVPCFGRRSPPCAQVAGPQAGPKRPKITQNGARYLNDGSQWVPLSFLSAQIHLGNVWVAFWPCLDPFGP